MRTVFIWVHEQKSHRNHDHAPAESHEPQDELYNAQENHQSELNHVDPLTSDGMNTRRKRNKIPRASALKSSKLLGHRKLPFGMNNSIAIRGRLKYSRKTILGRGIAVRRRTGPRSKTISRLR